MTFTQRHLPHWQPPNQDIFITWRLHGSLPGEFRHLHSTGEISRGNVFVNYDRTLDKAQTGPLWLKDPRVAEVVVYTLKTCQLENLFTLPAYTLMPNHVHVLLTPHTPLNKITQRIKGATARAANCVLNRTGIKFWQNESFDHWIRTPQEFAKIRTYIEQNPVAAGLIREAKEWPWSSASNPI